MKDTVIKAILSINPNAEASVSGNDINTVQWHNGTTPISKADIEAKMNEMANEPEQSNYAQLRRNAYPEIGDQLDMLWHSIDQDPQLKSKYFDFYEAIKAVKVKYPKNG
jgi:alpha-N-acetylglucosamine transferase